MNMFLIQELKPKKIFYELNKAIADQRVTMKQRRNSVIVAGETLQII